MKILSLTLKNINSLAGMHEIDFTHPRFTNEGLFAITGKTGAGKSTILDAITLALYGKTPRLGLISGNENNLMTRGARDCFSEIVFSVSGRKWKASWKQERTKSGNLKPIHRIIADGDNHIVADQVRACDQAIVDILGLSFEQFTKVILLAQGSFAAFLQANKNDKGELLEQITGTEIYANISIAVHTRVKQETDKLTLIETELNAIHVLSDEDEEALMQKLTAAETSKQETDTELKRIQAALKWLENVSQLENQIEVAKEKLPALESDLIIASNRLTELENTIEKQLDYQKDQADVYKQVRELDTKVLEKQGLLKPLTESLDALNDSLALCSTQLKENKNKYQEIVKQLDGNRDWLKKNNRLESLLTEKGVIESEHNRLRDLTDDFNKNEQELNHLVDQLNSIDEFVNNTELEWKKTINQVNQLTEILNKAKEEQASLLNGKSLLELSDERNVFIQQLATINRLMALYNDVVACRSSIHHLENEKQSTSNDIVRLTNSLRDNKNEQTALAEKIRLIEENLMLSNAIRDLHEHRQHLKDGEPCPLCGAIEHPFVQGDLPVISDNRQLLDETKDKHSVLADTIIRDEKEISRLSTLLTFIEEQLHKERDKVKTTEENIINEQKDIETLSPDPLTPDTDAFMSVLKSLEKETNDKLNGISELVDKATQTQMSIEDMRDNQLPGLVTKKEKAQLAYLNATNEKKLIDKQLTEKKAATLSQENTLLNCRNTLQKTFDQYGVSDMVELQTCFNTWNDHKKNIDILTENKNNLETSIRIDELQQNNLQQHVADKNKEVETIEKTLFYLTEERKTIFGDRIVDKEESALVASIREMQESKRAATNEQNKTKSAVDNIKSIITANAEELERLISKRITDKTEEELSLACSERNRALNELLQQIGAYREKKRAADENRKVVGNKLADKEKQQAVVNKWAQLDDLIGSATGIKFRNFAQALTFEHLVASSNTQLQKMSDRYLLQRTGDHTNPFELSVIDKYQNSEIRTAQNLSGGEKFIVSLSLALGLANMASKNMRIDTMFIDEGFGTLDPDYLDVALNALSSLQHEGKIIGVISHLSELKERISTHIEIVSTGNGHAAVKLPY